MAPKHFVSPASALVTLLAPPRCPACGEPAALVPGIGVCAGCRQALAAAGPRRIVLPATPLPAVAATLYAPPATGLVEALKSGRVPGAAAIAAELIAEALPSLPAVLVLVPVGAAPLRRLRRGLDPAAEIAIALSGRMGLGCAPGLLRRRGARPQRGRSRAERLAAPPRFEVRAEAPARALIVDDVITTGATLSSCASALTAAGTRVEGAVAMAWAPAPGARNGSRLPAGKVALTWGGQSVG